MITSCENPQHAVYSANVECAAGEYALHLYIDQTFDPDQMIAEDRTRLLTLYRQAQAKGRLIGISPDTVREQITARGKVLIGEALKTHDANQGAMPLWEKSQKCLPHADNPKR